MSDAIERDAEEFGRHIKSGGWRLGFLVARNVERGLGQGRKPPGDYPEDAKVSASEFARMAGLSDHKIVTRYLDAWDRQAPSHGLPTAARLRPGHDLRLAEETLGRFRVTEPEAITHENDGWQPSEERGRRAPEQEESPGSFAHSLVAQAWNALDQLASHRSSWQFMTEEDMTTLSLIPAKVSAIIADVNHRGASVRAS